ncbi:hypothetical protein AAEQ23_004702 [Enterobacter hormaechei]|uniref:hypothetical protein n=1 Tax=Enterobacter hormaechei TaxID=158836 RepID=UPI0007963222|nr:hypothetical protein [Enterobacter hormaechei]MCW4974516.1 hypothetical protein [Enterobacter hormaechei subsp. xiangfangensis]MDY3566129.1 hypothetical protein [Enterobacter hormaechei]CZZ12925.1 Uncharacterised protein [Enterobacter hormaechei]SAB59970.1 Uncharacterised protein [Enterobacter hormaechei]SAG03648.1 Uncharacterised protein [Enterobacter hormaechei]
MSEQSKGVVSLKAGFIYQKVGATEGEPVIDASGMSDEQIFGWMEKKVEAVRRLQSLVLTKAEIEKQLSILNTQIEEATAQSRIEVFRPDLDPTPHR